MSGLLPEFTPAEQAHLDSKGDAPIDAPATPAPAAQESPSAPAETPAPAADVSRETSPAEQPEAPGPVPYAALKEERERRKGLEKRLQDEAQTRARLEGRLAAVEQTIKPVSPPPGPLDPTQNPIETLQDLVQFKQQTVEERQRAGQFEQFTGAYAQSAREFSAKTPDFGAAYNFAITGQLAELQAAGYSQDQAQNIVQQYEIAIVSKAFQDGVNPAERLYAFAQTRGYKKADPAPVVDPAVAAQEKAAAAMGEAAKKLGTIARGQAAGKSLSGAGGASVDTMTIESLLAMDDEEFGKLSPKAFRRIAGGE